ncbi:hypothetical protein M8C21_002115 [Ambrosia artemisiifolia]|uniref:Uncharacterized protein n=1 Tax=Ambrosia artemisiifolia TaxID=4212 RepID=A0AAD5G1D8_AMBAR|nr:hypothetical protein M8C21_002115 [Ambrosia artemisiifolia]
MKSKVFRLFAREKPVHKVFSGGKRGLPLVQQYLFQLDHLMREYMPKLGEHFTREMINGGVSCGKTGCCLHGRCPIFICCKDFYYDL